MAKTLIVFGHGPGISEAVATKFGREGFAVALIARSADRVRAAASALEASGIRAAAFPADLADPDAVKAVVAKVRESLGPVTVVHWNAYAPGAGDLISADLAELRSSFDVSVTGLVAAVQSALPDLKTQRDAAVLVTGGGLAFHDAKIDAMAVEWNVMGLAVAKAAQHKLTGLLSVKLRDAGVFVGEVTVLGIVKGTAFDHANGTIEASAVARKFWDLYVGRREQSVTVS